MKPGILSSQEIKGDFKSKMLNLHPFSKLRDQAENSFCCKSHFFCQAKLLYINSNDNRKQIY